MSGFCSAFLCAHLHLGSGLVPSSRARSCLASGARGLGLVLCSPYALWFGTAGVSCWLAERSRGTRLLVSKQAFAVAPALRRGSRFFHLPRIIARSWRASARARLVSPCTAQIVIMLGVPPVAFSSLLRQLLSACARLVCPHASCLQDAAPVAAGALVRRRSHSGPACPRCAHSHDQRRRLCECQPSRAVQATQGCWA